MDKSLQIRKFALYIIIFFVIWAVRATIIYPVDEIIQSESAAWRRVYADIVRLLIWVVPVFVYLTVVDKVDALQFLFLKTPLNRGGLFQGSVVLVTAFGLGILFDYVMAGNPIHPYFSINSWQWYGLMGLVIPPFAEEILLRGFVLQKCQEFVGFWSSNGVAGVLFVASHWPYWIYSQGWNKGLIVLSVRIFVIGIFLGYLVRKSNSLWPSIVAHILNNFMSVTLHVG